VLWTNEYDWDSTVLDHDHTDNDKWYKLLPSEEFDLMCPLYDAMGDYHNRVLIQEARVTMVLSEGDEVFYDLMEFLEEEDISFIRDRCIYEANFHRVIQNVDATTLAPCKLKLQE